MAPRLSGIVLSVVLCGSGFADPRLTGVLADPRGKGDVFRSESRLGLNMPRLHYMERWRLCLNAKMSPLTWGSTKTC
ncbi:hypothetical protein M885DRAFT_545048, partial [Pelagophyceae sp. CCMP2097]